MTRSREENLSADGLRLYPRLLCIFTITLATAASSMGMSIVNVALPTMAQALAIAPGYSVAIVSAYQIAMVAGLLPLAGLGEILGYRRVYLPGLLIFALASLMVSASNGVIEVVTWRFIQGLGAAGVLSVNTAILRFVYPRRHFGRGLGLNAFMAGTSMALGPPVAALILSVSSWHWLFLVNVPLCLLACAIGYFAIPHTSRANHKLSRTSITLHIVTFALLTSGLNFTAINIRPEQALIMIFIGTGMALIYIRREKYRHVPLIPIDLFKIPDFRASVFASMLAFCAQIIVLTILPFWLSHETGRSAAEIGWLLAAWPASSMLAALASGALSESVPAKKLCVYGLTLFGVGVFMLVFLSAASSAVLIILSQILCGLGFGLFQTPNNRLLLSAAPQGRAGSASGSLGTARMVGQSLGSAVAAMLLMADFSLALPLSGITASVFAVVAGFYSLRKRSRRPQMAGSGSIIMELTPMNQSNKPEIVMLYEAPEYLALLRQHATVHDASTGLESLSEEVLQRVKYVVTTGFTGFSGAQMRLMPALRLICCAGTGFENVDHEVARGRGIYVSHGAGDNAAAVADQAMGLLLDIVRGISLQDRKARDGLWRTDFSPYPMVAGKKIGIFGMGQIGEAIARRATGFDLKIMYHSRTPKPQLPWQYIDSLEELARQVDFLICCAPGGKETFHAVNARVLDALGSQGYLVNVGRGSIVDTQALITALNNGAVGGAGLDVFETEPAIPQALRLSDKTVLTVHTAGVSIETQRTGVTLVMRNIAGFERDGVPLSPIPPMAGALFNGSTTASAFSSI
ncbi:MFS transporter [Winslowiella toletana]|uniref:MFS transporter n=1 Tax=Winslowiella toletana TaxID=92490 RepID=UPI0019D6BE9F|nr:MFS transporter [Winslowiella toletana]